MKKILIYIILSAAAFSANLAAAATKCKCPTISAEGEGNSSCSAAEANSLCTVDYNEFGPFREQRAAQLLAANGMTVFLPQDTNAATAILNADTAEQRLSVIGVYLLVAAAGQDEAHPELMPENGAASLVIKSLEQNKDLILSAFSPSQADQWLKTLDQDVPNPSEDVNAGDGIVVAPGCVELAGNGVWLMFKAWWSPVRRAARCGGPDLKP